MDFVKLNERIRLWRESRGITKAQLARDVGVSPAAVSQWEQDKGTEPTHTNVAAIASAIGVSLSVFYGAPPHDVSVGRDLPVVKRDLRARSGGAASRRGSGARR